MTNRYPITNDPLEYDSYSRSQARQTDTKIITIIGKSGTASQDVQLRVCGASPSNAGTIELWSGDPNLSTSTKVGTISAGGTTITIYNKDTAIADGAISINQDTGYVGINKSDPQTNLDVYGEVITLGNASSQARFRWRGLYTSNPSDPPSGCSDAFIFDNGSTVEFRVRYNDSGVMRVGKVSLVAE